MAHEAAKAMAEQFVGEPKAEPYSNFELFVEPVTGENVYHARGNEIDEYDLIIPQGILSAVLRRMPFALQHMAFNGQDKDGGIFIEFSQKGEWTEATTKTFGNALIFKDVWPKKIDNFEACERIEVYRVIMEQIVRDAVNASKKANKKKKS